MIDHITIDDILGVLSANSDVPSMFGAQLDQALRLKPSKEYRRAEAKLRKDLRAQGKEAMDRDYVHRKFHTMPIRDEGECSFFRDEEAILEAGIMRRAAVYRCVSALERRRFIRFASCPDVDRFARDIGMGSGAVVIEVLRAFEKWRVRSVEAGYASVYVWMRSKDGRLGMPISGNMTLAQVFREEKTETAKALRKRAARLVNDAMVVLSAWVQEYSRPFSPAVGLA